ncbi:hypothetical protein A3A55_02010 [Candidatus Roizmanbacteria bacterium RIFCSPLOWO2_01_FULL_40_14]|nr:MAG: Type 4 prepilin-like protein leader peptide-processing enzyme [Candidatus Levybacteria bacterium GW2011_GWA2_40_16]OGK49843.1 MAG: hypothetical protein A3A55_02010 [Candidatus Roizmanbacteria bacterium RIFCSPLOWO2_01_FULL_40_14]
MILVFLFILGLFIGSFLNVLIDRLPREEQIVKGRSKCDHCKHVLAWYDLLPVISWVFLKGKCRYCKKQIDFRNTLVELLTGTMFVLTAVLLVSGIRYQVLGIEIIKLSIYLIIVSCLMVIFFIDLKHKIIPDSLTILVGITGVLLWFLSPTSLSYINYLLSAAGSAMFFLFLVFITKGRGMGMGDVKFAFVMGLLLGSPGVIIALYIAFLTGAILSAILILSKRKKFGQTVPFGPFLVVGTLIVLFDLVPAVIEQFIVPYYYF